MIIEGNVKITIFFIYISSLADEFIRCFRLYFDELDVLLNVLLDVFLSWSKRKALDATGNVTLMMMDRQLIDKPLSWHANARMRGSALHNAA